MFYMLLNKIKLNDKKSNVKNLKKLIKIVDNLSHNVTAEDFTSAVNSLSFHSDFNVTCNIKYGFFSFIVSHKERLKGELNKLLTLYQYSLEKNAESFCYSKLFDQHFNDNLKYIKENLYSLDLSNNNIKCLNIVLGEGFLASYQFENIYNDNIIINSIFPTKNRHYLGITYTLEVSNTDFSLFFKYDIADNIESISFENKSSGMIKKINIGLNDSNLYKKNFSFYKERLSDNYSSNDKISCLIQFNKDYSFECKVTSVFFNTIVDFLDLENPIQKTLREKDKFIAFNYISPIYNSNFDSSLVSKSITDILILNDISIKYKDKYDSISIKALNLIKNFETIKENTFYINKKTINQKLNNI